MFYGEAIENRFCVRIVLHRKIGSHVEDDGLRFIEPAVEMKHSVCDFALQDLLRLVGLLP